VVQRGWWRSIYFDGQSSLTVYFFCTLKPPLACASGLTELDVRAINDASLMVRGKVVQGGIRVYERDHAQRVAFEVGTRKRYFDFAPVARRLQAAFLDKIRREGLLHLDHE
jgi:hypothetical protein